ncbi:MAG: beta-galactosidase [Armatimonadetes bacterium]|nr:beta-galactosidase [Armatimonadota bacterium]
MPPVLLLLLTISAPPPLARVGVISVHEGTIPPRAIRDALHLGYALNWRPVAEQQALAGEGCLSMHFEPRPPAEVLQAGLGLTRDDLDQDPDGHLAAEGYQMATFDARVIDRYAQGLARAMSGRADLAHVAAVSVPSPISRYGEAHYAVSDQGGYLAYSRPAKAAFRRWLAERYATPAALSRAWGEMLDTFDAVQPPRGPQPGPDGLDTRRAWSDWLHWYNAWLLEVTDRTFGALRGVTDRPLCLTLGGMKAGYAQGVFAGNVGPTVKGMAAHGPALLDDTDAQTLFSLRYTSTACAQYGVALMCEPVGPPHLSEYAQLNTLINGLSAGSSSVILPHMGELCRADHWFTRIWGQLAPVFDRYETHYRPSPAAVLHSYVTSWYRADRQNMDAVRLYDATNTNWSPDPAAPSWGRALGSPDVVDDLMVADGVLAGRRLLVVPNSGVTVTTRAALERIVAWVRGGGTLVAFGPGALAYAVEADRHLAPTPGLGGLVGELTGERLDQTVGRGRVVWYRQAAHAEANRAFCLKVQPALAALARQAGVTPVCRVVAGSANVLDCGVDRRSGRHLFAADLLASVGPPVTFARGPVDLAFDPALRGPAELVAVTDRFVSCQRGQAKYDSATRVLTVRFDLPGPVRLDL